MTQRLYRFSCWLDLRMHDVMDDFNTFTVRGQIAAWIHYRAHELAFLCRTVGEQPRSPKLDTQEG